MATQNKPKKQCLILFYTTVILTIRQSRQTRKKAFFDFGFILMRAADFNHVWLKSLHAAHEDSWKDALEMMGLGLIAEGARRASNRSA